MIWKLIEGYRWLYRISDQGVVQKQLDNGNWQTLKPYQYNGQAKVGMWTKDGKLKKVPVPSLMSRAFMGGTPKGMIVIHKNGMKWDNAIENLAFSTRAKAVKRYRPGNSRAVAKVDRNGNVLALYCSGSEAARANHISQQAISKRCNGLIEDPYRLDGFNYVFEDSLIGRKRTNKKRRTKHEEV